MDPLAYLEPLRKLPHLSVLKTFFSWRKIENILKHSAKFWKANNRNNLMIYYLGHAMRKHVFRHMWKAKAKISLPIRAIWYVYGPQHVKTCLWAYADSEGPDQPAHSRSLIRTFTVHYQNHWILQNVWMESKGPDDTLPMRRMIRICAYWVCLKALFHLTLCMLGNFACFFVICDFFF